MAMPCGPSGFGRVTQQNGWVIDNNDSPDTARCTNQRLPYVRVSNLTYKPDASVIWDGNHLHIPGVADDELLKNTEAKLPAIADGNTYPWVTDPKQYVTTRTFQVFDQPSEDAVIQVVAPEGVTQTIVRDVYGNPLSITQSGLYGTESDSVTKALVYDSFHRLCRTIEPESGSEVTDYDGANNVKWTASGLTINGGGSVCGRDQVRGYVDGVYVDGSNNAYVAGWACSSGIASSINVDLYVGGPAGSGIALGRYLANQSSEAAVASACGVGAGSFRFSIPLTAANRSQYVGQNIYVYGISPVGNGNPALTNSGNYVVPASPNAPPQPASLTATLAGDLTSISVTWAGSSGATSYTLQQNVSNGGWAPAYSGSGTSYVLSNPADGDYAYRVQACKSSDCSLFVISNTVSVRHIPLAPATISVPATSNGPLAVSWAASAYATSYTLEQSINGQAWAAIYSGSAISTSFSASATGSYTFRVKACNTNGCSTQYTTSSSVAVTIPPGSAPTLSSPSGSTTGSYTVSWTAVTGATYYNLQEQVGGNWSTVQSNSATSWGASGRGNGTYGYRVQACNAGGCSGWSGVSSTTILLPPSPAPSISAPGSNTTGSYGISWNSNATATYYQLWQLNPGSGWAVVQSTGATSWSVSGKTSGNYQYYVTACNASGCSAASATATVTVLLPPASAPSPSVPSNSTNGSYTVSWNAVTDGASYTLQESVNGGGWATVQANGATAWSTGGRGNASYGYRVQACNASGCGPWSGTATVTVLLPPPAPAWVQAPSYVHGQQYYITWASSSTATSYNVIRKNLDNGNTAVYTSTSATTVTIPIPGATQSIQWGAQACNASGCSGTTNAPNITNTDPPGPIN